MDDDEEEEEEEEEEMMEEVEELSTTPITQSVVYGKAPSVPMPGATLNGRSHESSSASEDEQVQPPPAKTAPKTTTTTTKPLDAIDVGAKTTRTEAVESSA